MRGKPTCENCRTPIVRLIEEEWICLNCLLYDAIHIEKDDREKERLYALIDATSTRVRGSSSPYVHVQSKTPRKRKQVLDGAQSLW